MSSEEHLGYAILPVADKDLTAIAAATGRDSAEAAVSCIDLCDTQGRLRAAGIFDQVRMHLCLPDSYAVAGMYWRWQENVWHVVVVSKDLSRNEVGLQLPMMQAIYQQGEDGVKRLVHIEVWQRPSLSRTYQMCSQCFATSDLSSDHAIDTLGLRVFFCQPCWQHYLAQESLLIVK